MEARSAKLHPDSYLPRKERNWEIFLFCTGKRLFHREEGALGRKSVFVCNDLCLGCEAATGMEMYRILTKQKGDRADFLAAWLKIHLIGCFVHCPPDTAVLTIF